MILYNSKPLKAYEKILNYFTRSIYISMFIDWVEP